MTTVFLRDSVEELPNFSVNLDGVFLNRRLAGASIACVQSFVRSPRITQRDFVSDNGIGLIMSAVNVAGAIREKLNFDPRENVLPEGYEATVVDLKKAFDALVVRWKDAHDTSERWFGVRNVEYYSATAKSWQRKTQTKCDTCSCCHTQTVIWIWRRVNCFAKRKRRLFWWPKLWKPGENCCVSLKWS